MDVMEAIKGRRSIRKYSDKEVDKELIIQCLEAARWAPSASNRQPWHFVVVRNDEMRKKLAEIHPYAKFIAESPVAIVSIGDPEIHAKHWGNDTGLANQNLMLAAYSMGLGTCWAGVMGAEFEGKMKNLLNIPDHMRILSLMALGYPADPPGSKSRKPLDEIVSWESFSK